MRREQIIHLTKFQEDQTIIGGSAKGWRQNIPTFTNILSRISILYTPMTLCLYTNIVLGLEKKL